MENKDTLQNRAEKPEDNTDALVQSETGIESDSKNKQLVPLKPKFPDVLKRKAEQYSAPMVIYAPIDSSHYSFTYEFDDTVSFRMDEAENASRANDFVEADFLEYVPESHKAYYAIAAASGALTGALSFIKLSEESLSKIDEFKKKDWEPIIIYAAELAGCKKKDYKSASKYLVDQAIRKVKKMIK